MACVRTGEAPDSSDPVLASYTSYVEKRRKEARDLLSSLSLEEAYETYLYQEEKKRAADPP